MDQPPRPDIPDTPTVALNDAMQAGRAPREQLLDERRQHLARLESTLYEQMERWLVDLTTENGATQQIREQVEQRLSQLREREETLCRESASLRQQLWDLEAQREDLNGERVLVTRRGERLQEREQRLEQEQDQLDEKIAETKAQRRRIAAEFRLQRAAQTAEHTAQQAELERLRQLEQTTATDDAPRRQDDLQRRFEMAVQDVRELKRKNSELQEQLTELRANPTSAKPATGKLDWEAQKKRLLAMLEETADDPRTADDRLTLKGAIHITDEVVAQRDREIAELKAKLADLESQPRRAPLVTQDMTDVFDRDAAILAERERLQQLQQEWRDKLKQAEIDISLERAKIARDRADIEDKLRSYEQETAQRSGRDEQDPGNGKDKKPTRGRWLTRLGLKDEE